MGSKRGAALLIIDVQVGLDDPRYGARSNPDAEANIARLLMAWRRNGDPVWHIQHMSVSPESPLRPQSAGNAIKATVAPSGDEPVIQKRTNSAFIGTDLARQLRGKQISRLFITGLTIEHCVSSTARMASDLGYETIVVSDATAAHEKRGIQGELYAAETVHALALANLRDEFAKTVTTEEALEMA